MSCHGGGKVGIPGVHTANCTHPCLTLLYLSAFGIKLHLMEKKKKKSVVSSKCLQMTELWCLQNGGSVLSAVCSQIINIIISCSSFDLPTPPSFAHFPISPYSPAFHFSATVKRFTVQSTSELCSMHLTKVCCGGRSPWEDSWDHAAGRGNQQRNTPAVGSAECRALAESREPSNIAASVLETGRPESLMFSPDYLPTLQSGASSWFVSLNCTVL